MEEVVILLRKDAADLTKRQKQILTQAYPDRSITFHRTDPADYQEHDLSCQELRPALVLLPLQRQIPSLAMEHGVVHVAFGPNDELLELVELPPPIFKPFTPRA